MDDNEKYVRSKWIEVGIQWGKIEGVRCGMAHSNGRGIPLHGFATEEEIWSAARAFTEARLKEIAAIEREVEWLHSLTEWSHDASWAACLGRANTSLAALKSGMREE